MINTEYTRIFVYAIHPSCTQIPPSRTRLLLVKTSISRNPRQNCSVGGYSFSCIRVQEVAKPHISRIVKTGGVQKERTPIVSQLEFLFGGELGIRTLGTSLYTAFRVLHLRPLGQLSVIPDNFNKRITLCQEINGSNYYK